MSTYRDFVGPALQGILTCVQEVLTADERTVALNFVSPGATVAWDNCCDDGGMLWTRAISAAPSQPDDGKCGVGLITVQIGVGILRCVRTITDSGGFPTADQMTGDALTAMEDMATILGALDCCARDVQWVQRLKIGTWAALGNEGGCGGGEWTAQMVINPCGCP